MANKIHEIKKELYRNFSEEVINYLETITKVHKQIVKLKRNNNLNDKFLTNDDSDIHMLSRLIALYDYPSIENDNETYSVKSAMIKLLEDKGITRESIFKHIGPSINKSSIKDQKSDVLVLYNTYEKYIREGINTGKTDENIEVKDIVANIFDSKFNNSFVLEKLLFSSNFYTGVFANFDEQIKKKISEENKLRILKTLEDFNSKLPKESVEFIEFTTKTYTLILKQMEQNVHNNKILATEDDADTLALFIAAHYFNTDVDDFFESYGITLDKILELLKLEISKEKIESETLDTKVLTQTFTNFIYSGVNRQRNSTTIGINNIIRNLCSSSFNQSTIINDIFSNLSNGITLENDFLAKFESRLLELENIRKNELIQKLFVGIEVDTIDYFENCSKVYQHLVSQKVNMSPENLKKLSLIMGATSSLDKNLRDFLKYLNINFDKIIKNLSIQNYRSNNYPIDIDLIDTEYNDLILNDKNRSEITIKNIVFSILSEGIADSVKLNRLITSLGVDVEDLKDIEIVYEQFNIVNERNKKEQTLKTLLSPYSPSSKEYIKDVSKIHQNIKAEIEKGNCNREVLKDENDIEELSCVLGLLIHENISSNFFRKRSLNLENIFNFFKLDPKVIENLDNYDLNIDVILNNYRKYLEYSGYSYDRKIDDIAKRLFDVSINKSFVIEELTSFHGQIYDILKEEVEIGNEHKEILTIEQRIDAINSEPVSELKELSHKNLIQFGNRLADHSNFIHNAINELTLSQTVEKSIASINPITKKIYTVEEPKEEKGNIFSRIFRKKEIEEIEPKCTFNNSVIENLNQEIMVRKSKLEEELLKYGNIKEYINVYRQKNRLHLIKLNEAGKILEQQLSQFDLNDEEQMLEYNSQMTYLRVIKDKEDRLKTTNSLMLTQLFRTEQEISKHFITLNALSMAQNDLMPLIATELLIKDGRDTENESLDLAKLVIDLFNSTLAINAEGTIENMKKLEESNIGRPTFELLNRNVSNYLTDVNNAALINKKPYIDNLPDNSITLSLEPFIEKNFPDINENNKTKVKNKLY